MDISEYIKNENEKPLDIIKKDGGFTKIFRTIACIGDSLSSGEFESTNPDGTKGYHDYYEYSWGQYIARATGSKVYNFSKGGMTARQYLDSFADEIGAFDKDKACRAYIIALGVNDLIGKNEKVGTTDDIDLENYNNNNDTFIGLYAKIIQKYKEIEPKARFFLVTMPNSANDRVEEHRKILYDIAELFEYTYVIDLARFSPPYDDNFKFNFYLGGHLNPMGYVFTGDMIMSYIDYIIRNNPEDFAQVGFVGTEFHNNFRKW